MGKLEEKVEKLHNQINVNGAKQEKGILGQLVKYEGDGSTFIWKYPDEDFSSLSELVVNEGQEAVLYADGVAADAFGPGRYQLNTENIPLLTKALNLVTGVSVYHCQIFFINKTVQMGLKWGTPDKIRYIDPLTSVPLEIGASGEMNLEVCDGKKLLIKLVGTMKGIAWDDQAGFTKSLQASFRPLIATAVKSNLSAAIKERKLDLLEIDEHLEELSACLIESIRPGFEEYGLTIPQFYVTNIVLPEEDANFKRIRDLHSIELQKRMAEAEASVRTAQEEAKAKIEVSARAAELERQTTETEIAKRKAERDLIKAQTEAQATQMAGFAEAQVMQAKGYNQKDVLQAEVQKAYAEGLGNMGPAVSTGGGAGIAGEMLGVGVGMAAMNAIAPQVGNMMQGLNGLNNNPAQTPMQGTNPSFQTGEAWDCACGTKSITFNFCPNCGSKRPEKIVWNCPNCGTNGITFNFCPNCGQPKA